MFLPSLPVGEPGPLSGICRKFYPYVLHAVRTTDTAVFTIMHQQFEGGGFKTNFSFSGQNKLVF